MMKYSKTYEPALPRSPLKTIPVQTESESSLLQNSATQDYSSNLFACRQHAHKRHSVYPVHSKISNFESSAFDKDTFLIAHLLVFARAMTVGSIALLGCVKFEGWGIGGKATLIQDGYVDDAAGRIVEICHSSMYVDGKTPPARFSKSETIATSCILHDDMVCLCLYVNGRRLHRGKSGAGTSSACVIGATAARIRKCTMLGSAK